MPISITNKWRMERNLPFSFFSVFKDADHPTLTLEQKSGQSDDANQTYLWASPNGQQWSLHSFFFYKNKYNKLNSILLILIHLFQPPPAIKCEWTEWHGTTCSVTYHWLIMILLLGISKNKSVLATFCIPVLQPIHSAIAPFAPPLPPPHSPNLIES